jgi:hypothetical protein
MAAEDDELLLMLVQADVCLRCSMSALQLLLHYACQVRLCWTGLASSAATAAGLTLTECVQHVPNSRAPQQFSRLQQLSDRVCTKHMQADKLHADPGIVRAA